MCIYVSVLPVRLPHFQGLLKYLEDVKNIVVREKLFFYLVQDLYIAAIVEDPHPYILNRSRSEDHVQKEAQESAQSSEKTWELRPGISVGRSGS